MCLGCETIEMSDMLPGQSHVARPVFSIYIFFSFYLFSLCACESYRGSTKSAWGHTELVTQEVRTMKVMKRRWDEGDDKMIKWNIIIPGKETVKAAATALRWKAEKLKSVKIIYLIKWIRIVLSWSAWAIQDVFSALPLVTWSLIHSYPYHNPCMLGLLRVRDIPLYFAKILAPIPLSTATLRAELLNGINKSYK